MVTIVGMNRCLKDIVVLCIGSDKVLFDSFGAIVGSLLIQKRLNIFVYGRVGRPITSANFQVVLQTINRLHKNPQIIVIDACKASSQQELKKIIFRKGGSFCCKGKEFVGDYSLLANTFFVQENHIQNVGLSQIIDMAKTASNFIASRIKMQCK